jgi:hypothetical protein
MYINGVSTANFSLPTGYAYFLNMMFTISNKGSSNQQITIGKSNTEGSVTVYGNTSDQSLKNAMFSNAIEDSDTRDWNLSGIPYKIPNAVFSYFPYTSLQLRIHNLAVIKVQ